MKGEDAYLNKQGSTSTMPDSHTKVTIQHLNLKKHAGILCNFKWVASYIYNQWSAHSFKTRLTM